MLRSCALPKSRWYGSRPNSNSLPVPKMTWLQPLSLTSASIGLEPLGQHHCADLIEAVKDGELWTLWYTSIPSPAAMHSEIERRMSLQAIGSMLPFAVIDKATKNVVGMTT